MSETDLTADNGTTARPRRMRRGLAGLVLLAVGVLLVVIIVGVSYLMGLSSSYDKAETVPAARMFPTDAPRPTSAPDSVNILLLGSDSRNGLGGSMDEIHGQRADSMLLVHIPADRSGAQVISFMRDNWVDIPGYGESKLNAALAYGGAPLLVQTLEQITDVRIDHVAITDFEGFKGLSEALGGVVVDNQLAFSSGGHHFAKGTITLRGDEALAYVRTRYAFPDGDYQRVRNQQAFLKGMLDKLLSKETLTDPGRLSASVEALAPFLAVDEGLNAGAVASLGISLRNVDKSDVLFLTSPTLGTGMIGDQSIVRPDWDGLAALSEALKNDTVPEFAAQHAGS